MKNKFDVEKAKQYLRSWQRLNRYGMVGKFLSPEIEQFKKEKEKNPEFENDNVMTWLIKKALSYL